MEQEIENWWKQAKSDLKAAQNSLKMKDFDWVCFQAQQAAEKALKALYLQNFKGLRKVHDLVFLAKKLNAPSKIINFCEKLNQVYTETRYPDVSEKIPAEKFSETKAKDCIQISDEIIKWVEKNF